MVILFSLIVILLLGFLIYASTSISSGVYINTFCKFQTDDKLLALTFDDGPDERITPQVLEILRRYQIPAVFFCIGKNINGKEGLLQQMVNEGHLIGNHTYSHTSDFPIYPVKKMKTDIQKCENLIAEISQQKELSLFRPPFGVTNPNIKKMVTQMGFRVMGWSIRSFDTSRKTRVVIKHVQKMMKPGSIILFHDTVDKCPEILEAVVKYALQNNYKFVRADKYM